MDPPSTKCKINHNFSQIFSFLEEKYQEVLDEKKDLIQAVYKKLTAKDVRLEFKEDPTYYQIKKKFWE